MRRICKKIRKKPDRFKEDKANQILLNYQIFIKVKWKGIIKENL